MQASHWPPLSSCTGSGVAVWCCTSHSCARAGRLRPLPTDADSGAKADYVDQNTACELIDMGAFHLAEFADSHCRPIEGSAVHGGIHVLQIMPPSLMGRLLFIPPLAQPFKVGTMTLLLLPLASLA